MKILNVVTGGLDSDGITNAWLTFVDELRNDSSYNDIIIDFAQIDGLSNPDIVATFQKKGIATPLLPKRLNSPVKYFRALYKLLKNGGYNAIHANGSSSLLFVEMVAGLFAGTPLRIAHSRNTTCNFKFLHYLLKIPFLLACNGRISCGKEAGEWLFGKKDFKVLYNGKNLNRFKFDSHIRDIVRQKLQLGDELVFGHVGKFNHQKNHMFLLDVFGEILKIKPDSKLILIGDGPLKQEINDKISRMRINDKVILLGEINNVNDILNGLDIMIFPSLFEGLPNVVLEWQASGLKSFISDTITKGCALSDLVQFMSLNDSPEKWAMKACNADILDRKRDSDTGIKALKDAGFDIKDCVEELSDFYRKNLNNR